MGSCFTLIFVRTLCWIICDFSKVSKKKGWIMVRIQWSIVTSDKVIVGSDSWIRCGKMSAIFTKMRLCKEMKIQSSKSQISYAIYSLSHTWWLKEFPETRLMILFVGQLLKIIWGLNEKLPEWASSPQYWIG